MWKHDYTSCSNVCLVNGKKSCREEKGTNRFRNGREEAVVAGNNAMWFATKTKKQVLKSFTSNFQIKLNKFNKHSTNILIIRPIT